MFVDASALVAILSGEPEAAALVARLQQARQQLTSPLAIFETTLILSHILDLPVPDTRQAVPDYLAVAGIQVVAYHPRRPRMRWRPSSATARAVTRPGSRPRIASPLPVPRPLACRCCSKAVAFR